MADAIDAMFAAANVWLQPLATIIAGLLAVLAAAIAYRAVKRQIEANAENVRDQIAAAAAQGQKDIAQRDRAATITELWKRFEWVAGNFSKKNGVESLIDGEQAAEMLASIRDAARDLDQHLCMMLVVFLSERVDETAAEIGLDGGAEPSQQENGG